MKFLPDIYIQHYLFWKF